MSDEWIIGIIGGSGLSEGLALEEAQEIEIRSPFGEPSGPVTLGRIGHVRVAFLARHGKGHRVPPSQVNYRANIDVLKRARVTDVLALSAIGSLREEIEPGQFVAPHCIAMDSHGAIYVGEVLEGKRIQKFVLQS